MDAPFAWFTGHLFLQDTAALLSQASQKSKHRPGKKGSADATGQRSAQPDYSEYRPLPPPSPQQKKLLYAAGLLLALWLGFLLMMGLWQ